MSSMDGPVELHEALLQSLQLACIDWTIEQHAIPASENSEKSIREPWRTVGPPLHVLHELRRCMWSATRSVSMAARQMLCTRRTRLTHVLLFQSDNGNETDLEDSNEEGRSLDRRRKITSKVQSGLCGGVFAPKDPPARRHPWEPVASYFEAAHVAFFAT